MKENVFELYVDHPLKNTSFPLLMMDINNNMVVPPRQRFQEMHWHNDLQVSYVLKGNKEGALRVITMNHCYTINEGEIVFINKNVLHQILESEDTHYRSLIFPESLISFSNDLVSHQINRLLESDLEICVIRDSDLINELDKTVYNSKNKYREYYISLLLSKVIYTVLINNDINENNKDQHIGLQQCLCFIHLHYNEDILLSDIAGYGNMSEGHCERLFKSILDTSPIEYLINYRIKKSLELLNNSNHNVTDIAMEVGFNSASHFIQSFKKRMGITPKQYRKQTSS